MHRRATTSCLARLPRLPEHPQNIQLRQHSHSPPNIERQNARQKAGVERMATKLAGYYAREPRGWKHTKSLRGPEKRLEAKIKLASHAPSNEQVAFDANNGTLDVEDLEVDSSSSCLAPGTFVETRRNELGTNGVVLAETVIDRRLRLVVLTSAGEIWLPVRQDILFSIPSFVPSELAIRCGLLDLANQDIQINARVEVLKRLRQLEKAEEAAYSRVCRKHPNLYDLLKASNPNEWSSITLSDVAKIIAPSPDAITTLATHHYLISNPIHFITTPSYDSTQIFDVRPSSHVEEIQTIQEWSRLQSGPLQLFAKKARDVITHNRKIQEDSRAETPSYAPGKHSWTSDDKIILSFLLHSLRPVRSTQSDPYSIGQSAILKSIDPKRPIIDESAVHQALVDLGVLAPWQDLSVLSPDLRLDLEEEASSSLVKVQDALVAKALLAPRLNGPLGPEDFHPSDPLESVRHDFGNMPVYVIDGDNAEELDDGISIERIPSEPDNFWIHVHVADPASVIPPTHVFAKEAALKVQSAYFGQQSWPLLPRSLMRSPTSGLSLGSIVGKASNVLTFTTKVDARGEASDFRVRAGLVNKIQTITYDAVDFGLTGSVQAFKYPFGGGALPLTYPPLTESQSKDLRDLMLVAKRLTDKRYRDGVFTLSSTQCEFPEMTTHSNIKSPTLEPSSYRGFPKFAYGVIHAHESDSGARGMVSEMMKLACRAISQFCLEKGVPVLRRVSGPAILSSETHLQTILDMRTPNCHVSLEEGNRFVDFLSPGDYSLEPKGHFGLGIKDGEGYVRGTSPLRRYSDLVTHWQLHHALLGPAASSKSPPFGVEQLQKMTVSIKALEKLYKLAEKKYKMYWQIMFFKRWIEDTARGVEREHDPLKNLEGYTLASPKSNRKTGKQQADVNIPSLAINGLVEGLDSSDIPRGTVIQLEVKELRLGTRPLLKMKQK